MKPTIKNLKTKFLYIILPVGLILILVIVLYQSNQKIKLLKSGIDLKPRPFSELLATDFADVKDEVTDPSKCDGSKVIEQIKKSSTNPNLSDKWKDYDPNIHKLTILDDCWRQYENEYVRFKFRDLNGSLHMYGANYFSLEENGNYPEFIAKIISLDGESIDRAIIKFFKSSLDRLLNVKVYKNPGGLKVYRAEVIHLTYKEEIIPFFFVELPNSDKFIYLLSYSKSATKGILSTIEMIK